LRGDFFVGWPERLARRGAGLKAEMRFSGNLSRRIDPARETCLGARRLSTFYP
jgi:hypothetical protein